MGSFRNAFLLHGTVAARHEVRHHDVVEPLRNVIERQVRDMAALVQH